MLAIRMQRTGRKGHAQFRLIVQDKRFSPKSGRVVAFLGSYDPHSKKAVLDSEKASKYLSSGAQPTDRVVKILKEEGVKLPAWVSANQPQKRSVKSPEKLRRNRPAEAEAPKDEAEQPAAEVPAEETATEATAEEKSTEARAEQSSADAAEDSTEETAE